MGSAPAPRRSTPSHDDPLPAVRTRRRPAAHARRGPSRRAADTRATAHLPSHRGSRRRAGHHHEPRTARVARRGGGRVPAPRGDEARDRRHDTDDTALPHRLRGRGQSRRERRGDQRSALPERLTADLRHHRIRPRPARRQASGDEPRRQSARAHGSSHGS
ncbi:hypothetical protein ACFPRL_23895 [Pseudoclavibacter helvolus]